MGVLSLNYFILSIALLAYKIMLSMLYIFALKTCGPCFESSI